MTTRRWLAALVMLLSPACSATGGSPDDAEDTSRVGERVSQVANACCTIQVKGVGARDTELDYLPHVIACEDNGADLQALKAQAIAARSVAYYNMATSGSICDGQGCQVYSCNNQPGPLHYQAVAETVQEYLSYGNMLTYGFYVSGDANVSGPGCMDSAGSMLKYITFNDGKTGTSVKQSKLGFVGPPGFGQNRGCMSQHGARCLEQNGRDHVGILRFYYGDDIGIVSAPGSCPKPTGGEGSKPGGEPAQSEPNPGGSEPGSEPPPSTSGSCVGSCGSSSPVPGSSPACYCDSLCTNTGDCCGDFSTTCGSAAPPPPAPPSGSGSCAGSCGSSSPAPGSSPACYCDGSCAGFGDCCADFNATCK